ncbi:hypothetical protein FOZ61_002097 [Perkinsus olseni]|uniref:Serine hydroxymethyltransferase n=1 Tax=Perkinsus olseni TaxID=32597 RepID=A0A7J6LVP0_PEROL|nr:hypothetical protein FOZ61_002097 [Perkinsus olseni]
MLTRAGALPGYRRLLSSAISISSRSISVQAQRLNAHLPDVDPEVDGIIEKERGRQKKNLVLIASENFTSQAVLDAIGSIMTNKYSEGYPNARYYGGNEFIDQMENLCRQRALDAYRLSPEKWGVNVQPLSGSPANFQVYTALMEPHDRLMALDLPHGGHLSHGYQTDTKKVSMVSKFWTSMPYRLDEKTGLIDYDELELLATRFRPKILITGYSAYPRFPDFKRFREIADKSGSSLMCDMAHISGLVAAGVHPSPFEDCDVVTTTTHKTLRGPRGAMIFYRIGQKGVDKKGNAIAYDYAEKINSTVFPGMQGGPHNHIIAGLSVALKQAASVEFREYQEQVVANAAALATEMQKLGFNLVSGGTENHLMLVDLKNKGINGSKVEKVVIFSFSIKVLTWALWDCAGVFCADRLVLQLHIFFAKSQVCELASITLNKNTVPGDKSAMNPSGLRIGSPAMTSRGAMGTRRFEVVTGFEYEIVQKRVGSSKQAAFNKFIEEHDIPEIEELRREVETFASSFEQIGKAHP